MASGRLGAALVLAGLLAPVFGGPLRADPRWDFGRSVSPSESSTAASVTATPPTTAALEDLEALAEKGTEEAQSARAEELEAQGRGELREYLETRVLLRRARATREQGEDDGLVEALEAQAQLHRDRLGQASLDLAEIERRIESLEAQEGGSDEARSRRGRALEEYRQIRTRLTNRHDDEKE